MPRLSALWTDRIVDFIRAGSSDLNEADTQGMDLPFPNTSRRPAHTEWSVASVPRGSRVTPADLEKEVQEYFDACSALRPGSVIVDVGANIGAFTRMAAQGLQGDITSYCFEPAPELFSALCHNLASLSLELGGDLRAFPMALGSPKTTGRKLNFHYFRRFPTNSTLHLAEKRREFELYFASLAQRILKAKVAQHLLLKPVATLLAQLVERLPRGTIGFWITRRVMGHELAEVRMHTLGEAIERLKIPVVDLLKIDVEGHELAVLQGISPLQLSRIRQIVLETKLESGHQHALLSLLSRAGYRTQLHPVLTADNGLHGRLIVAQR